MSNKKSPAAIVGLLDAIKSENFAPLPDSEVIPKQTYKQPKAHVGNIEVTENLLLSINPNQIRNWEFHDRPEKELGDLQALADDFIKIGQQQPCIVRPIHSASKIKYELIIGERRWRAAKLAGVQLKVIIDNHMSDEKAALAQVAENDNRIDLSDYAKGMSFYKLITEKIIKQKDLIESLGRSQQYVSALLSFSKIPKEIIDSVSNWSLVSARTSETIVRLSKKGVGHVDAIIKLSDRIKSGKLGANSLEKNVMSLINTPPTTAYANRKILSSDGRHMFTWRMDNNKLPSIHFPKQINELFLSEKINIEDFTGDILKVLKNRVKQL